MAQKNATPSKGQQMAMEKAGLKPYLYTVIRELNHEMIVKHRITGEVKVIPK